MFKLFFYVVTNAQRWGRGATQIEALNNANLKTIQQRRDVEHFINTLILKPETPDDAFANLQKCWAVNDMGDLVKCSDVTEEDQKQIDLYFVGWANTHIHKGKVV